MHDRPDGGVFAGVFETRAPRIVDSKELSRRLGIKEYRLQALANKFKLPFGFSTAGGLFIRRDDLGQWQAAARQGR